MPLDMEALAKVIDAAIERRFESLYKRIAELESRAPIPGPKGDPGADGKSIDIEAVRDMIEGLHAKHALELERRATDYLERLEVRDGIDGKDGQDGAPGMDGRDGQDADVDEIVERAMQRLRKDAAEVIERAVSEEVAKIPLPQDGKDGAPGINGKDGKDGINGKDGAPGEKGMDGRDGQAVTPEMVEASVAKLIEPKFAAWELQLERRNFEWMEKQRDEIRKTLESMPKPKDGRDGIGVKDLSVEYDGERTWVLRNQTESGEVVQNLYLPIPLYRDVWKADTQYSQHDMVTHDGSTWIALEDSKGTRPGHMQKAWKLIVKKGRDGK